jgi:hypothetical protein
MLYIEPGFVGVGLGGKEGRKEMVAIGSSKKEEAHRRVRVVCRGGGAENGHVR